MNGSRGRIIKNEISILIGSEESGDISRLCCHNVVSVMKFLESDMIDGSSRVPETLGDTPGSDYPICCTVAIIGDNIPNKLTIARSDEKIGRLEEIGRIFIWIFRCSLDEPSSIGEEGNDLERSLLNRSRICCRESIHGIGNSYFTIREFIAQAEEFGFLIIRGNCIIETLTMIGSLEECILESSLGTHIR